MLSHIEDVLLVLDVVLTLFHLEDVLLVLDMVLMLSHLEDVFLDLDVVLMLSHLGDVLLAFDMVLTDLEKNQFFVNSEILEMNIGREKKRLLRQI